MLDLGKTYQDEKMISLSWKFDQMEMGSTTKQTTEKSNKIVNHAYEIK